MGKKGNRGTVMSLNEFNNTPTAAEQAAATRDAVRPDQSMPALQAKQAVRAEMIHAEEATRSAVLTSETAIRHGLFSTFNVAKRNIGAVAELKRRTEEASKTRAGLFNAKRDDFVTVEADSAPAPRIPGK